MHSVSVRPTGCGTNGTFVKLFFDVIVCAGSSMAYSVYPNPGSTDITIEANENGTIERFKISDYFGNIKMMQSNLNAKTKHSINISSLAEGMYKLEIYDGKKWHALQILKK